MIHFIGVFHFYRMQLLRRPQYEEKEICTEERGFLTLPPHPIFILKIKKGDDVFSEKESGKNCKSE